MTTTRAHRRLESELKRVGRFKSTAASRPIGTLEARLRLRAETVRARRNWKVEETYAKGMPHLVMWGGIAFLCLVLLAAALGVAALFLSLIPEAVWGWNQGATALVIWKVLLVGLIGWAGYETLLDGLCLQQHANAWQDPNVVYAWSHRMKAHPEWSESIAGWLSYPRTRGEATRLERAWSAWAYQQEVQSFMGSSSTMLDEAKRVWENQLHLMDPDQRAVMVKAALTHELSDVGVSAPRREARI